MNSANIGTAKWVPEMSYLPIYLYDNDKDGVYDEIIMKGILVNSGYLDNSGQNRSLELYLRISGPVGFDSCSDEGGTGDQICPKCENTLCSGNTFLNWTYYTMAEGYLKGDGLPFVTSTPLPGGVCNLTTEGLPLVQLGKGANSKNDQLGLSTWLNCEGDPSPGSGFLHTSDININIRECPEEDKCGCGHEGQKPCRDGCHGRLRTHGNRCVPCGGHNELKCTGPKPCDKGHNYDQTTMRCKVLMFCIETNIIYSLSNSFV